MVFRASASRRSGRDLAVIILAGAQARYRVAAYDWDTSVEHQLALDALMVEADPEAVLVKLGKEASRIVSQSWPEISPAA
jgi:hypothetical protein